MNVCPATVNEPVRGLVLVLVATYHVTVPMLEPLAGVQVNQLGELLDAVQLQPVPAFTVTVPLPAPAPGLAPVDEIE